MKRTGPCLRRLSSKNCTRFCRRSGVQFKVEATPAQTHGQAAIWVAANFVGSLRRPTLIRPDNEREGWDMSFIPLKARLQIGALTFVAAAPLFRGVTTMERVMKNTTLGAFAFAFALALASTPGHAVSVNFTLGGSGTGTTTGHIDGLQDNATGPATAIFVDTAPPVFNLTAPLLFPGSTASPNSFTVTSASNVISFALFDGSAVSSS